MSPARPDRAEPRPARRADAGPGALSPYFGLGAVLVAVGVGSWLAAAMLVLPEARVLVWLDTALTLMAMFLSGVLTLLGGTMIVLAGAAAAFCWLRDRVARR